MFIGPCQLSMMVMFNWTLNTMEIADIKKRGLQVIL